MTTEDEKKVETSTLIISVACLIAGVTLVVLGHSEYGAPLLAFATGAAMTKPLIRGDR